MAVVYMRFLRGRGHRIHWGPPSHLREERGLDFEELPLDFLPSSARNGVRRPGDTTYVLRIWHRSCEGEAAEPAAALEDTGETALAATASPRTEAAAGRHGGSRGGCARGQSHLWPSPAPRPPPPPQQLRLKLQ
ncbi:unnamed protein product, partial [Prorocentrum cordatum]